MHAPCVALLGSKKSTTGERDSSSDGRWSEGGVCARTKAGGAIVGVLSGARRRGYCTRFESARRRHVGAAAAHSCALALAVCARVTPSGARSPLRVKYVYTSTTTVKIAHCQAVADFFVPHRAHTLATVAHQTGRAQQGHRALSSSGKHRPTHTPRPADSRTPVLYSSHGNFGRRSNVVRP